jgi:hypothetical protein
MALNATLSTQHSVMLRVVTQRVVMLKVVMLRVVMLKVVMPVSGRPRNLTNSINIFTCILRSFMNA